MDQIGHFDDLIDVSEKFKAQAEQGHDESGQILQIPDPIFQIALENEFLLDFLALYLQWPNRRLT